MRDTLSAISDYSNLFKMKVKMSFLTKEKETVSYIINALKEINSNPNHNYSAAEVKRIRQCVKDLSEMNQETSARIREINDTFIKGIEAIKYVFSYYGDPVFQNLKRASEIGWYISPQIIAEEQIAKLSELLTSNKLSQFENLIIKKGDKLVPIILKQCSTQFPNRKNIFEELKKLYSSKCYYSLITLAYTQADGICNEVWGFGFFDREKFDPKQKEKLRKLELFKVVEGTDDSISAMITRQLEIQQNEITQSSFDTLLNEPSRKIKSFNRHLVQHGHSLEYGTKVNAIRSIYLLDFIIFLLQNQNKTAHNTLS